MIKTQMAANRQQTMGQALRTVWSRGGVAGFYQGLIPWAWIEASTKGAVLLFVAAEVEKATSSVGISQATGGLLGGISGGVAQAYATMGAWFSCVFLFLALVMATRGIRGVLIPSFDVQVLRRA